MSKKIDIKYTTSLLEEVMDWIDMLDAEGAKEHTHSLKDEPLSIVRHIAGAIESLFDVQVDLDEENKEFTVRW